MYPKSNLLYGIIGSPENCTSTPKVRGQFCTQENSRTACKPFTPVLDATDNGWNVMWVCYQIYKICAADSCTFFCENLHQQHCLKQTTNITKFRFRSLVDSAIKYAHFDVRRILSFFPIASLVPAFV